jgi:hypothetical protein
VGVVTLALVIAATIACGIIVGGALIAWLTRPLPPDADLQERDAARHGRPRGNVTPLR